MEDTDQTIFAVEQDSARLDLFLKGKLPQFSRSYLQKAIKEGVVTVDGVSASPCQSLKAGMRVAFAQQTEPQTALREEHLPLQYLYCDDSLLIVNKQAGMVCHPGAGVRSGTVMQGLLYHYPELRMVPRAGLIHRLDKGTSGLLMVARTADAHQYYTDQLSRRDIERTYRGIVFGHVISGATINRPLARDRRNRLKRCVVKAGQGRASITHYRVHTRLTGATELLFRLESGRNHQIRAHLESERMGLVGDTLYGNKTYRTKGLDQTIRSALLGFWRPALHAWKLTLTLYQTNNPFEITAPLPQDYSDLLAALSNG